MAQALAPLSPSRAILTATIALCMVTIGCTLAMLITGMYILRLIVHGLPPSPTGWTSTWINVGPWAQSGYAAVQIGTAYQSLLPLQSGSSQLLRLPNVGMLANFLLVATALLQWAFATAWMVYAVLATWEAIFNDDRDKLKFHTSFWGTVFPSVCPPVSLCFTTLNAAHYSFSAFMQTSLSSWPTRSIPPFSVFLVQFMVYASSCSGSLSSPRRSNTCADFAYFW